MASGGDHPSWAAWRRMHMQLSAANSAASHCFSPLYQDRNCSSLIKWCLPRLDSILHAMYGADSIVQMQCTELIALFRCIDMTRFREIALEWADWYAYSYVDLIQLNAQLLYPRSDGSAVGVCRSLRASNQWSHYIQLSTSKEGVQHFAGHAWKPARDDRMRQDFEHARLRLVLAGA